MKSERRHELQHNELADWLALRFETIRPYQNWIFAVVVLLLVGLGGYAWWSRQARAESTEAWTTFNEALNTGNPTRFAEVIERYPGTRAAEAAAVVSGDLHLNYGTNLLFVNKASANQELRKAIEHYLLALDRTRQPSLRERATYGLARATEAQSGDLDEAIKYYEQVYQNWPNGPFAEAARRRADDLKRPATREMYDRFAQFDPAPAFLDAPGVPGERPDFDFDSLPEGPIFTPGMPPTEPSVPRPPAMPEEPTTPDGPSLPGTPALPGAPPLPDDAGAAPETP